jgi:pimeloyl-ACP methyl ester carboxylesterase
MNTAPVPPQVPDRFIHQRFSVPSADGYPLRGDVRYQDGVTGAPAVVVCHGFKGFKEWGFFPDLAGELARAGYLVVNFNFSGSGIGEDPEQFTDVERFEHATLSGDLDDLGLILDAVAAHELPGPQASNGVGLLGHSRGGAISLLAAHADPRVSCLVTWASVAHLGRWDEETRRTWRERGHVEVVNARTGQVFNLRTDLLDDIEENKDGRLNLERAARDLAIPHLIVHGEDDESVPVAEGRELAAWGRGELLIIPETGHTFGAVHPYKGRPPTLGRVVEETVAFFGRHNRSSS